MTRGRLAADAGWLAPGSVTESFCPAAATGQSMTLRHTAIRVADVDAEVEFYADLAGYEVVRSFEADDGTRNVFVGEPDSDAADDAALQLVAADGPVETGDFVHVALGVESVDETVAALDDNLVTGGPETLEDDDLRVAFVEDPEGWGVELIEEL